MKPLHASKMLMQELKAQVSRHKLLAKTYAAGVLTVTTVARPRTWSSWTVWVQQATEAASPRWPSAIRFQQSHVAHMCTIA